MKLKYLFLIAVIIYVNKGIKAQDEKIRPLQASNNLWGYKDLENKIVVKPIFDNVTPLIRDFYEVDPKELNVIELLQNTEEITFFKNPIGIVIKGDSLGIVDHQGKFILNPIKCKLRTIYQESEIKFVENLEESSDDYGKIALITQSGLFISPFLSYTLEEYEGGRLEPHLYYYCSQMVTDIFLRAYNGSQNIFFNQTDGFIKNFPDSIALSLISDGYYFIKNTQKQKLDLFHNDTHIKSIDIPEKYHRPTYYTKGIFSMTNGENTILMDTVGKIYYTVDDGYLEGINDHGHARVGKNGKIFYIDHNGREVFETKVGDEYYSEKDGYYLVQEDSITYFNTNFEKLRSLRRKNEDEVKNIGDSLSDLFYNVCQDSLYFLNFKVKKLTDFENIKIHEFENGKYGIVEFEFESGHYFYSKCSKEPFFPYEAIHDIKYIGNDIFFVYIEQDVIVHHFLKGKIGKFDNSHFGSFLFQGKKYYYSANNDNQDVVIYDESFNKFNRNYNGFNTTLDGIQCGISHFIEKGKFLFEVFGSRGNINFEKLDPNFAFENIRFWLHKDFKDSYSIYLGVRDTFSFHIVELNFSNIIENPQDYKVHQYILEFDPHHNVQTKQKFLDKRFHPELTVLDSLICVETSEKESVCLDLNKRAITKIDNTTLYPETYSYFYNRRVKIDCFDVGYIDKQGKQVIPLIYNLNHWTSFKYGVAIVSRLKSQEDLELEYGLIDTMGKLLIPMSDCVLNFDHLGKIIVKECRNSDDGYSKFSFYDLKGNFLADFEYVVNRNNYLYASLPSGGNRLFTGDINSYIDVDDAVEKNDQLWAKKDGLEYTFDGSKLVLTSLPLFKVNKQKHFFLTPEMTIQVDDSFLTFVQNGSKSEVIVEGEISQIDFVNGFVYIKDKYYDILIYDFEGKKILESNHFEVEYFPKYKLFIKHRYNDISQRSIYKYHYINN